MTTLLLTGDVMTGRGIDQVMPTPVSPTLHEGWIKDARDYVRLAERMNGPIPAPVAARYVWGEALAAIETHAPALRLVNLETAVTTSDTPWPDKGIHYRMHPAHVACLKAAGLHGCVLANNHVLDWGAEGLRQTLETLHVAGLRTAGADTNLAAAHAPAVFDTRDGRLLLFARAAGDSGVPACWAAAAHRPGVARLSGFGDQASTALAAEVAAVRQPGDLVVISLHWGANWVPSVPQAHRRFARALIDLGAADLVWGHSSHHPLPLEVHRGRLILYGCGDLLNDYEGIVSHDPWRSDLGALYLPTLAGDGTLRALDIVPTRVRRFQLVLADAGERAEVATQLVDDVAERLAPTPDGWRLRLP